LRFGPAIRNLDTQRRILVFNVFITPIFSFVQQFYMMPSDVLREYRSIMRTAIGPFGGKAWPYSQLCAPTAKVGFRQPLRDPWVHGMTMLLKSLDFDNITSEADLPWRLDGRSHPGQVIISNWDSPLFTDHTNLQLMEFLGKGYLDWDGTSRLPKLNPTRIKEIIIDRLILSYAPCNYLSYSNNFGLDHNHHLNRKIYKLSISSLESLALHFSKLPKKVPPFLISYFIKVICGATNSDGGRRRKFDPTGSVHPNKCAENPFPCYLCDKGDIATPGDSSKHLFNSCGPVSSAWDRSLSRTVSVINPSEAAVLEQPPSLLHIVNLPLADPKAGYCRLALLMAFCWACHKVIDQIRMGRSAEGADARIAYTTLSLRSIWAPSLGSSH
jgi:hypothetical protein